MASADSTKAILYALGANFAIAVAKYGAAAVTDSGAMLAEAVHSTADCANQLLLLLGMRLARRAPTPDYPLGFGKETYFWSFIVAIMLFSMGGLFSLHEGWSKLHEPQPLSHAFIALAVLGFGFCAELVSMWGVIREANKVRGDRSIWSWLRHTRNSELVVVFGEDLAALLGLALAFAAVLAAYLTGNVVYDALGTLAIGVLLIVVAVAVGIEVKAMLIGQGVEPAVRTRMMAFLGAQPAVERVFEVLTLHMGGDVMVAVKAKMRPQADSDALAESINAIEAAFKSAFPEVRWVFFEPDIRD